MKIDDHMGIGMSGLTADGRSLVKYVATSLQACNIDHNVNFIMVVEIQAIPSLFLISFSPSFALVGTCAQRH